MSLIHNERVKLLATYVNGLAIAVFAVGGLAPILSLFTGAIVPDRASYALWIVAICIVFSAALHFTASLILRRMVP